MKDSILFQNLFFLQSLNDVRKVKSCDVKE